MKKISISTCFSNMIFIAGLWVSLVNLANASIDPMCDSTWQNSSASGSCGAAYCFGSAFNSSYWGSSPFDDLFDLYDNDNGNGSCVFHVACLNSLNNKFFCTYSSIVVSMGDSNFKNEGGELKRN